MYPRLLGDDGAVGCRCVQEPASGSIDDAGQFWLIAITGGVRAEPQLTQAEVIL